MQSIAFVVPLLPGKTETDRDVMRSCWTGERRDDFARSRTRLGITREAVFIQSTPGGDFVVVYQEANDIEEALRGMAASSHPFDQWFRDHVREVHGVNLEDGFPPPEQVMDYRSEG